MFSKAFKILIIYLLVLNSLAFRISRVRNLGESKISDQNNRFEDFLLQEGDGNKANNYDPSLSEGIRIKLKSEVVSPFRRFRQFLLFGLGAAAGLGVFTAIPQV